MHATSARQYLGGSRGVPLDVVADQTGGEFRQGRLDVGGRQRIDTACQQPGHVEGIPTSALRWHCSEERLGGQPR